MNDRKLIDRYNPYGIGIESMFRLLDDQHDAARATNYPYYNLYKVKKLNEVDDHYYIEIAVAGFHQDEIQVSIEKSVLEVSAKKKTLDRGIEMDHDKFRTYYYRSLSYRDFTKKWLLDQDMVVQEVRLVDGILTIFIQREVPDHLQKRMLDIYVPSTPELLKGRNQLKKCPPNRPIP